MLTVVAAVATDDEGRNVLVNQGIATVEGTFEWKEIMAPLRRVPGAVGLQLVLGLQESTGTVWFDDIAVTPVGATGVTWCVCWIRGRGMI